MCVGGIFNVDDDEVRPSELDEAHQLGRVACLAGDVFEVDNIRRRASRRAQADALIASKLLLTRPTVSDMSVGL